jgi:hypothetical protein
MRDYLGCIILVRADYTLIVIAGLHGGLTCVVTFPMELTPCDIDQLVEIKASRKDAKQVYKHLKIVEI